MELEILGKRMAHPHDRLMFKGQYTYDITNIAFLFINNRLQVTTIESNFFLSK